MRLPVARRHGGCSGLAAWWRSEQQQHNDVLVKHTDAAAALPAAPPGTQRARPARPLCVHVGVPAGQAVCAAAWALLCRSGTLASPAQPTGPIGQPLSRTAGGLPACLAWRGSKRMSIFARGVALPRRGGGAALQGGTPWRGTARTSRTQTATPRLCESRQAGALHQPDRRALFAGRRDRSQKAGRRHRPGITMPSVLSDAEDADAARCWRCALSAAIFRESSGEARRGRASAKSLAKANRDSAPRCVGPFIPRDAPLRRPPTAGGGRGTTPRPRADGHGPCGKALCARGIAAGNTRSHAQQSGRR